MKKEIRESIAAILDVLPIKSNMNILDLGAGSGYLVFAKASRYPDSNVGGLDVVVQTLKELRFLLAIRV